MKLGIVHPSVLATGLADLAELARRDVGGIQVHPSLFVDGKGRLREPRARSERRLERAKLELVAWTAYRSLVGPPDDVAANLAAQKKIIDLAGRFRRLAPEEGTPIVCTAAGRPDEHPDRTPDSLWGQLLDSAGKLAAHAARRDVVVAFEPRRGSLLGNSVASRKLLSQLESNHVGVCFDPANFCGDHDHLGRALDLLCDAIVLAHAKDVVFDARGRVADLPPAGQGQIDYAKFIERCSELPGCGYVVLESLRTPEEADEAIAFVHTLLSSAPARR